MKRVSIRARWTGLLIGVLLVSSPLMAFADDGSEGWSFEATPYLYLFNLTGDTGVGGAITEVDSSIFDMLDGTDVLLGALINVRARRGPWSVLLDVQYLYAETETAAGPVDVSVDAHQLFLDAAVAYEVGTWPDGSTSLAVDVLAGARYTLIDTEAELSATLPVGDAGLERAFELEPDWIDPIVGLRARAGFGDDWSGILRADVGGFGAGSDLSWKVGGVVGCSIGESLDAWAGYLALAQDYEDGGFVWDMVIHGPVIGLGIRF